MNEHERTLETTDLSRATDHRRLDVAARRFADRIEAGLAEAHGERREIDEPTARMIAHVLGRTLGPSSALATFGREGEGSDEALREEYLALYNNPHTQAATKQWIDWLGTYLVSRNHETSGRKFQNEHLQPQLDRVLYRDQIQVGEQSYTVHIPGTTTGEDVHTLTELLRDLDIERDEALQAYLTLSDVNAAADNLMESFHEAFAGTYPDDEAALRALSPLEDWEDDLADWCVDHGVDSSHCSGTTNHSWSGCTPSTTSSRKDGDYMPSSSSDSAAVPPKRARGRPPKVRNLFAQPVARRTVDVHRLVKLLVGLAMLGSGRVPPDRPDSGARP